MNKPTNNIKAAHKNNIKAAHKNNKQPRDPRRAREILSIEELGNYTPSYQIDPWRGQFMQLGWDYCV